LPSTNPADIPPDYEPRVGLNLYDDLDKLTDLDIRVRQWEENVAGAIEAAVSCMSPPGGAAVISPAGGAAVISPPGGAAIISLSGRQLCIDCGDSEWSFFTNRISVTRITTTKNSPNRKKMGPN